MSEPRADLPDTRKCPVCGKLFTVLDAKIWRFKRNGKCICSWTCLRAQDNKTRHEGETNEVKRKGITLEEKKKAVQIALDGGNPLGYLEGLGIKNSGQCWYGIKLYLKDNDPETLEKLPKKLGRRDAVKKPQIVTAKAIQAAISNPPQEEPKIFMPVNYDGFEFEVAKSTETGFKYEYSRECDLFSIKAKGDEMRLCLEDMKALVRELPKAAKILGVEL